jgi:hypothetical protein
VALNQAIMKLFLKKRIKISKVPFAINRERITSPAILPTRVHADSSNSDLFPWLSLGKRSRIDKPGDTDRKE